MIRPMTITAPQAHTAVYKKGFDLTISPLRTVFDVNKEPKKVIEEYGGLQNGIGMGCLLARKLGIGRPLPIADGKPLAGVV